VDGEVVEVLTKDLPAGIMTSNATFILMSAATILAANIVFGQPASSTTWQWLILAVGIVGFAGYITFIALTIRQWRRRRFRWVSRQD
jgi:uncharacterized membrane protein YgdD (TMEM256/DUF423 family)